MFARLIALAWCSAGKNKAPAAAPDIVTKPFAKHIPTIIVTTPVAANAITNHQHTLSHWLFSRIASFMTTRAVRGWGVPASSRRWVATGDPPIDLRLR